VLPVQINVGGTGVVQFPSVTGLVNEGAGTNWNGADGGQWDSCFNSVDGISGILLPNRMALLGVFLSDAEPGDPAPPRLDFNTIGLDFASITPLLQQTFFIGDGRDASGALQSFVVPEGATRLFLGIADASSHRGAWAFTSTTRGRCR
jgi:hypothetical protein